MLVLSMLKVQVFTPRALVSDTSITCVVLMALSKLTVRAAELSGGGLTVDLEREMVEDVELFQ
jgi:hypothetical protein